MVLVDWNAYLAVASQRFNERLYLVVAPPTEVMTRSLSLCDTVQSVLHALGILILKEPAEVLE